MRLHFISGLPRSGSTLLASILRQNPRFHASIMTPTGQVFTSMLAAMGVNNEAKHFITEAQRESMLRGAMHGFYAHLPSSVTTVFDNNRRWTANASALFRLWPDAFMLCCVRSPAAIVDSFERLYHRNPLHTTALYGGAANTTVYERVHELMKPQGVVGFSLNALRTAYFGPHNARMLMVEYDQLCRFPAEVMADVYKVLDAEAYPHRFDMVSPIPGADEFDRELAAPGLHDVKPKVTYEPRTTILPPDIFRSLPTSFWQLNDPATTAE